VACIVLALHFSMIC